MITRPGAYCPAGTPLCRKRAKETEAITFFGTCETRCSVLGLRDRKKLPPCCEDSCHAGRREKKNGRWRGLRQGRPASVAGGQKRARKAEERTESADSC